jgi:predicted NAD-dependent protein-ADP-ribosyltransferase YbiA (DUF1768 family)
MKTFNLSSVMMLAVGVAAVGIAPANADGLEKKAEIAKKKVNGAYYEQPLDQRSDNYINFLGKRVKTGVSGDWHRVKAEIAVKNVSAKEITTDDDLAQVLRITMRVVLKGRYERQHYWLSFTRILVR